ncbi:MAG TPA: P-loop NTPase fold protein, partial [Candidatus Acidoferrales bacterium]|nr:P-loop NTPase fold protein [Candidatus Acidoferrales bacterium]
MLYDQGMAVHPDAPISNFDDDTLKRKPYALSIARMILGYEPSDSVILALVGKWGCGKSSLINLITTHIEDLTKNEPGGKSLLTVMRFNPWRYSGSDYLFASFFSALASKLGTFKDIPALREASKRLDQLGGIFVLLKGIPVAGGRFAALGEYFKTAGKNVQDAIKDATTLDTLHDQLTSAPTKAKVRILVIIDDIDRLAPAEILQTFQLVKSLADFPYVMYILAYDESVVTRAIDPDKDVAKKYLEKIVTLPIPVPPAHRSAIDSTVLNGIFELLKVNIPPYLNEQRLLDAFMSGWRSYVTTVRDVTRFLNVFDFHYARERDNVDIGDLAAITALEVFEHALYDVMSDNPGTFIDTHEAAWRSDKSKPLDNRKRLEELLDSVHVSNREAAVETLRRLFYKIDLAYKGNSYDLHLHSEREEHRACVPEHFFKFFNMGVLPSELEPQEFSHVMNMAYAHDPHLLKYLNEAGTDKTMDFVDRIPDQRDVALRGWVLRANLAASLFDLVGSTEFPAFSDVMPFSWKVGYALDHALATDDATLWTNAFVQAISETQSPGAPISHLARTLDLLGKNSSVPNISDRQIAALKAAAVAKVRDSLTVDALTRESELARLLYVLRQWGESGLTTNITSLMRGNPMLLLQFITSHRQRTGFEGILKPLPVMFDAKALNDLIPVSEIRTSLA